MTRAQPPLEFIPPAFNSLVLRGSQLILPFWLRASAQIDSVNAEGCDRLAELYAQFQQKKVRLILAFRHPSTFDPPCLTYLLWKLIPQTAKQKNIPLDYPIHAHFLYDRGIPLWAGDGVGWLASHLGGTSIQRGKLDVSGLRSARQLLTDSRFPLAAAPEGSTNGHSELIGPLEPGIAQLSFWCVDDLRKAKREEEVLIVPIGIKYHYTDPPWQAIAELLTQLEQDSGLVETNENPSQSIDLTFEVLYSRLFALAEHILTKMEDFYRQFYHRNVPKLDALETEENGENNPNDQLSIRLRNLFDIALRVAEEYFKIEAKGNFVDRCRRLEQAGWDCIYRDELKASNHLSAIDRGLADLVAEEADLRLWHMRFVDNLVAINGHYIKEKPTAERFAETTLLAWDLVNRLKGKGVSPRPQLGRQWVQMRVGQPLSASQRWDDYRANRRNAVADLTQDLQAAIEQLL